MAKDIADFRQLIWFEDLRREDVALVGGKNASLGEMVSQLAPLGIKVPPGYATTSDAYRAFIEENGLRSVIAEAMAGLDAGTLTLHEAGQMLRKAVAAGTWPLAAAMPAKVCRSLGRTCDIMKSWNGAATRCSASCSLICPSVSGWMPCCQARSKVGPMT